MPSADEVEDFEFARRELKDAVAKGRDGDKTKGSRLS